jgi:hypothetical protein
MKNLKASLVFFLVILVFKSLTQAQTNDTLRYFEYKQAFKLAPTTSLSIHPYYKAAATNNTITQITHVGSVFKNKDAALRVYGLETRLYRTDTVSAGSQTAGVQFRLYLCNVVNGFPFFPAVDSVQGNINNIGKDLPCPTCSATPYRRVGKYFGANFTGGARLVTGDFAVLGRNISAAIGDTVNFFCTAGHTSTSTTAPNNSNKFGEGLGVLRKGGAFFKTTNYNDPAFGIGTDYEFCFSPMVTFSLQVSQIESTTMMGACHCELFTHTNTASPEFVNRQFNFNAFYRELKPFHPLASINSQSFTADSVITWDLGDGSPPTYLPIGSDSAQMAYVGGTCNAFFNGTLEGKFKKSAFNLNAPTLVSTLNFTGSCVLCNNYEDTSSFMPCNVGLKEYDPLDKIKIYPNPSSNRLTISWLEGVNTIVVYNLTGQEIFNEIIREDAYTLDLSKFDKGLYLFRINNLRGNKRLFKIIRV